jgi:hypothetical protein
MNSYFRFYIVAIAVVLLSVSCKKQTEYGEYNCPAITRMIEFFLYTDTDFSGNNSNITFTLSIQNAGHRVLWGFRVAANANK